MSIRIGDWVGPEEVTSEKNESGKRRWNASRPMHNENSSIANPLLRRESINPNTVKITYCQSLVKGCGGGMKPTPRPLNVPLLQ